TGAVVTISDNLNNIEQLKEISPGIYQTSKTEGVEGRTYTCIVNAMGNQYTAVSTMPLLVPLTDIQVKEKTPLGKKAMKAIEASFDDPAGETNYYLFSIVKNDRRQDLQYVIKDDINDGQHIICDLLDEQGLEPGDNVQVSMQCIDEKMYRYCLI